MRAPRDVDVVLIGRPVIGQALLGCFLLNPINMVRCESKQADRKANQRDCGWKQWKERIHLNVLMNRDTKKPPPGNAEQGWSVGLAPDDAGVHRWVVASAFDSREGDSY